MEIHLADGIGYCPNCLRKGQRFTLTPHLKTSTTGKNIPLFCKHCKTEYLVDIPAPSFVIVRGVQTPRQFGRK